MTNFNFRMLKQAQFQAPLRTRAGEANGADKTEGAMTEAERQAEFNKALDLLKKVIEAV